MSLHKSNKIITDNLAIDIDATNSISWNLNNAMILSSKTRWNNTIVCDAILPDFGLTAFDNGRTDSMDSSLTLSQYDSFKLHRIGYNTPTGGTFYDQHIITPISGSSVGNYFNLDSGYFQGFFKLYNYDYEQLPARYNKGITIETLLEILPQSQGIFYYMGTRAEDKYNKYFEGEAGIVTGITYTVGGKSTGNTNTYSGRTTSEGNYLTSDIKNEKILSSFPQPEYAYIQIDESAAQIENISNNVIAFDLTSDYRIGYRYINKDGLVSRNVSPNSITKIGWTVISIVYEPYEDLTIYDGNAYTKDINRNGDLNIYINGRLFWKISDFNEFYFIELKNDKEKQLGVPFTISWGGGSFGLKHSYHFSGNTITKDILKDNLTIEKYFNDSFIGNIQKLRVYDNALTSTEILNNAIFEARSNLNYNIAVSSGGRLIEKNESFTSIPQVTSGSDIRKSVKYRNADGSYKDLLLMTEIMVVVKSRSNSNVELVKFKKTSETGWLDLIFMNIYTYDFIVPNTVTAAHPNEILYAEIKFQWTDLNDIDLVFDKIFVVNITSNNLTDNNIKNY